VTDHDPYTCDTECCKTHEQQRCAMCGGDRGTDYTVAYMLGAETDDAERWGAFREPDKWITICAPCDSAWLEREYGGA
jgi:hypothetical protein